MIDAKVELSSYLEKIPPANCPKRGAIAIQGGHGSGKTHLPRFGWRSRRAPTRASASAVAYVKCDSSNFFELYQQIFRLFSRDEIIALVQLALLNLARDKALSVKVTESLAARLQQAGSLVTLQSEKQHRSRSALLGAARRAGSKLGRLEGNGPVAAARRAEVPTIGQTA